MNIHPIRSKYNIYNIRKYFPHSRWDESYFDPFFCNEWQRTQDKDSTQKEKKRRRAGVLEKSWTKNEIRNIFSHRFVCFFLIPVCRHHFVHAHITRPFFVQGSTTDDDLSHRRSCGLETVGRTLKNFVTHYIRTSFALYFGSFKICLHIKVFWQWEKQANERTDGMNLLEKRL